VIGVLQMHAPSLSWDEPRGLLAWRQAIPGGSYTIYLPALAVPAGDDQEREGGHWEAVEVARFADHAGFAVRRWVDAEEPPEGLADGGAEPGAAQQAAE